MRPLKRLLGRAVGQSDVVELTTADLLHADGSLKRSPGEDADLRRLSGEIEAVADYVKRLRADIARVKLRDLVTTQLPSARADLGEVRDATRAGAETIMTAAEAILTIQAGDKAAYEAAVGEKVMEILEACSFQDISGQRLSRVEATLEQVLKRLERLSRTVKIADADTFDREAIMREVRREVLLVEGPQKNGEGVSQSAVDELFH